MNDINITLRSTTDTELPYLKDKMMEVFAIAAIERFGENESDRSPHADELERAYRLGKAQNSEDYRVYSIIKDGSIVGGAVLKISSETRRNKLELFFICKDYLNQGMGLAAWEAIERAYPQTEVWELITPYFEKRNINFYLNKCGFHIVEYFNKHHIDPTAPFSADELEEDGGYFRFEKIMPR